MALLQRIVTAGDDHTARVWNSADGQLLAILKRHTEALTAASFSPDGRFIVTASDDYTARVWSRADGRLLATLQGNYNLAREAVFSQNGERVLAASDVARLYRLLAISDIEEELRN